MYHYTRLSTHVPQKVPNSTMWDHMCTSEGTLCIFSSFLPQGTILYANLALFFWECGCGPLCSTFSDWHVLMTINMHGSALFLSLTEETRRLWLAWSQICVFAHSYRHCHKKVSLTVSSMSQVSETFLLVFDRTAWQSQFHTYEFIIIF
jgi:hypothetical protein